MDSDLGSGGHAGLVHSLSTVRKAGLAEDAGQRKLALATLWGTPMPTLRSFPGGQVSRGLRVRAHCLRLPEGKNRKGDCSLLSSTDRRLLCDVQV